MIREMIPLFITIFIVIDPLGIIPVYLSLSQTLTGPEKKRPTSVCAWALTYFRKQQ